MNKLTIIGNVTKDPVYSVTQNGVSVCTFNVAVNNKYKKDDPPEFFRVTTWRKQAETCSKYVKKSMSVGVVGAVKLSKFQDREGMERCTLAVDADEVEFLSHGNSSSNRDEEEDFSQAPEVPESNGGFTAVETDELPF